MTVQGRVESVDLKGTGLSGRAGDVAALMAAARHLADIRGIASRFDEGRLAGR
jgi:hypothetical protein